MACATFQPFIILLYAAALNIENDDVVNICVLFKHMQKNAQNIDPIFNLYLARPALTLLELYLVSLQKRKSINIVVKIESERSQNLLFLV